MWRFGGRGGGRCRNLAITGTVRAAESWAAHGGVDATPVDLCVANRGAGPCRLPLRGRTQPGGSPSHAVPGGGVPITVSDGVCVARARPEARDEGAGGQAAAKTARGTEVLSRPGKRPVRLRHP